MARGKKRIGTSKASRERRSERVAKDVQWATAIKVRDDHTCRRCHYRDEYNNHAHHIAPRSQRPDLVHVLSNGATVCPLCHTWIHDHPIESRAVGLLSSETYELVSKQVSEQANGS
jgi:nitrate/TMAO reductase-like tetraheme cytochrome c subunit